MAHAHTREPPCPISAISRRISWCSPLPPITSSFSRYGGSVTLRFPSHLIHRPQAPDHQVRHRPVRMQLRQQRPQPFESRAVLSRQAVKALHARHGSRRRLVPGPMPRAFQHRLHRKRGFVAGEQLRPVAVETAHAHAALVDGEETHRLLAPARRLEHQAGQFGNVRALVGGELAVLAVHDEPLVVVAQGHDQAPAGDPIPGASQGIHAPLVDFVALVGRVHLQL